MDHVLHTINSINRLREYLNRCGRYRLRFLQYIFLFPFFRLTFFVTTVMTTTIIISDMREGVWERSLVQGKQKRTSWWIWFHRVLFKKTCALKRILCVLKINDFRIKNNKYLVISKYTHFKKKKKLNRAISYL